MAQETLTQATVAVYPLRQESYEAVDRAIDALRSCGVRVQARGLNTDIGGSTAEVFRALRAAYEAAAASGETVMTITLSNACPAP
jgi:uncharacterized protein YqgV (UPF0045/DUF77 family)